MHTRCSTQHASVSAQPMQHLPKDQRQQGWPNRPPCIPMPRRTDAPWLTPCLCCDRHALGCSIDVASVATKLRATYIAHSAMQYKHITAAGLPNIHLLVPGSKLHMLGRNEGLQQANRYPSLCSKPGAAAAAACDCCRCFKACITGLLQHAIRHAGHKSRPADAHQIVTMHIGCTSNMKHQQCTSNKTLRVSAKCSSMLYR